MKRTPITDGKPMQTKKRKPPTNWDSDLGYDKFNKQVAQEGHTMVDDLEAWVKNGYNNQSTPPVLCVHCGARNETARIHSIMDGWGIGCACRLVSERRSSRLHPCNGQCGTVGCKNVYTNAYGLACHLSSTTFPCPVEGCAKIYNQKGEMYKHFRSKHSDMLADDGSCAELGIPPKKASPITLPKSYKGRVDKQTWFMLTKMGGYAWLVSRVKSHLQEDMEKNKFTDDERAFAKYLTSNNVAYHAIAQEILNVLIERRMFDDNAIDDAGGRLPNGFVMRVHGGVFRLSLDRKNNNLPHFLKGQKLTSNLHLVAFGVNTSANIVVKYGDKTCEVLRAKVVEQHSREEVERILQRAGRKHVRGTYGHHVLHQTCVVVFAKERINYDRYLTNERKFSQEAVAAMEQFRNEFPTYDALFQHILPMFVEQNGRCAISSILMDNALDAPAWFKPSLDAIDPRKRHVKGNLRIICRFLNHSNQDKFKVYDHPDDPESMWTRETFFSYIGV